MTSENIEKFLNKNVKEGVLMRINFKARNAVSGIFITTPDFNELKLKNFWRFVSQANHEQWMESKDFNLCRVFNGADFTSIIVVS